VSAVPSRDESAATSLTDINPAAYETARVDAPRIDTEGDTLAPAEPEQQGRWARARRSPLVRKITGYSAGSVIAAFTSELAFAGVFSLHAGTVLASLAGFVGGAIPNYILNRRWAWQDRRGRNPRQEIILYFLVSAAAFVVSVFATDITENWARTLTSNHNVRALLVDAAYLAVSGVFFVGKFVAYEFLVFTKGPGLPADAASQPAADATRS